MKKLNPYGPAPKWMLIGMIVILSITLLGAIAALVRALELT